MSTMSVCIVLCCIQTLNTVVAADYVLMFMLCLHACTKKIYIIQCIEMAVAICDPV